MKKIICIYYLQIVCFIMAHNLHAFTYATETNNRDRGLEEIRAKFKKSILKVDSNKFNLVERLTTSITEEGKWPDINYIDVSRQGFRHTKHLQNLKILASAYHTPNQMYYLDKKVKVAFDKGLNFWLKNDFKAENWWHNEFGTPKAIKDLLLIMDYSLSQNQIDKMLNIANRANSNAPGARSSGDRISIIGIEAQVALFERNANKFKKCMKEIAGEIRFGASDGSSKCLQVDYSFHHRVDRVNNTLSYGLQYANDLASWVDKVNHTYFQFPEKSVKLLIDFYLDGICKQMVYGKYVDTGCQNRDICRNTQLGSMSTEPLEQLMNASSYRKEELQNIIDIRKGKTTKWKEFAKFFWQTEYLTIQRKNFFTSVRMFSTRNMNMEKAYNGEGLKNHYRGDGSNYLTVNGSEYHSLPPVYDWMKIPGVTSVITPKMPHEKEIQKAGKMDFVGAVTDGYYASAAFDFISSHHALRAKKSWFFFDEEYVCLGSDINSSERETVVTTIDQTSLKGPVHTNNGIIDEGIHNLTGVNWLTHNNVTYLFPEKQHIQLSNKIQTGAWSNISAQTSTSKEIVSEKVMKLWIEHGTHAKKASYSYIVIPNKKHCNIKKYSKNDYLRVIANNSNVQAVEKSKVGISFANFYAPDKIEIYGNNVLEMQTPGLVIIKYNKKGKVFAIVVEDPTRKLKEIVLLLNGKEHQITLQSGKFAGASTTINIQ